MISKRIKPTRKETERAKSLMGAGCKPMSCGEIGPCLILCKDFDCGTMSDHEAAWCPVEFLECPKEIICDNVTCGTVDCDNLTEQVVSSHCEKLICEQVHKPPPHKTQTHKKR